MCFASRGSGEVGRDACGSARLFRTRSARTWTVKGVNFAVFSGQATGVELCLFDSPTRPRNRFGSRCSSERIAFATCLPDARPVQLYGYRVFGPYAPSKVSLIEHDTRCSTYAHSVVDEDLLGAYGPETR